MKTIFDKTTREDLIRRINLLDENSKPLWGKMNVHQMLTHCIRCEEMYLGRKQYKRAFMGRLFGRIGLHNLLKDDRPLGKNAPTAAAFKVAETTGDVAAEKAGWIALLREYENYRQEQFTHWFFGKMTKDQVGFFVYKHSDHHLRQFNC